MLSSAGKERYVHSYGAAYIKAIGDHLFGPKSPNREGEKASWRMVSRNVPFIWRRITETILYIGFFKKGQKIRKKDLQFPADCGIINKKSGRPTVQSWC